MGKIMVVLLFITVLTVIPVYAQSTLALQEKCAEGAKKMIEGSKEVVDYTSRYNKDLDRCFMRVGFSFAPIEEDLKWATGKIKSIKHPHWMVSLVNVFENKTIGECAYIGEEMQVCYAGDIKCKTIDEFENLLRPYME